MVQRESQHGARRTLLSSLVMRKLFTILVSLFVVLQTARALPVERFSEAIDLSCSPGEVCGLSTRSRNSLGGRLGISLTGGDRGAARLRSRGSKEHPTLEVTVPKVGAGALTLSWDGDPHPHQLSSGGLGCLNLRSDGAIAFKIEPFEVRAACEAEGRAASCQPIMIETRVYDPSDPTGQRYSASILRRKVPRRGAALEIPFSNFIHTGPRGGASFECVGAIGISIEVGGQRGLSIELGDIRTEGRKVPTVAETVTVETPSAPVETVPTRIASPTRRPSASPTMVVRVATRTPRPSSTARLTATTKPRPVEKPSNEESAPPQPAAVSVFGEVIASPTLPSPAVEKTSRRRLWD